MTILLWTLAAVLVVLGILGCFLPALPGPPLVFLGFLVAAWVDHFEKVGPLTLVALGVLTLLAAGVDLLASSLGAKRMGAGKLAIAGAAVGAVVGIFFGFVGLIIGPFVGAVAGEYVTRRELVRAGKVGLGTWLGLVLGGAVKVALVFAMIGIFVLSYVF